MQRVSASVVVTVHEMFLTSAKSGVAPLPEQIAHRLRRTIGGKLDGQSDHFERKRLHLQRLVEAVFCVCGEAARSGRFVSREEVARRAGIAVALSRPSVRRSGLQRKPRHRFLARRRQQHEVLRKETESADGRRLLKEMQADCEIFRQFASWTEVTAHMENGKIRRPETDAILIPIFERMERDDSPHWQTILLILFWNPLKEEHRYKKSWCPEVDDRWQNVVLAFLKAVRNLDLNRRQAGLAQKLTNDTVHHFYGFCREFVMRGWHQNAVRYCDPEILEEIQASGDDAELVEARDLRDLLIRKVVEQAEKNVISQWAADVLIATRLEGRRLKDLPGKGCSYETAKKRRQREEAKLLKTLPIWATVMLLA